MYMRASTLSSAVHTPVSASKKSSLKTDSVAVPTRCSMGRRRMSAFISRAARAAVADLGSPMSLARKRNWRERLLFSMRSMSVTVTSPSGPQPRPMSAQFLSISHPIAPAPTKKYRCASSCCCIPHPNTAAWPS